MIFNRTQPPEGTVRDWLNARAQEDCVAIEFPETGETLSWRALRDTAQRIARVLTLKGIEKGESVAVLHPNCQAGIEAVFGILYGGFRLTMINLVAGDAAISYALEHSKARVAFVNDGARDIFESCAQGIEIIDPTADGEAELFETSPHDHALLMYTSGTTGRPKGVIHTHSSLLSGGWTTTIAHELSADDRGLCVLPIYHINGLCVTVMGALISGGSLTMCSKFSASQFWKTAAETQVTWFSVVPTIISHLLHGTEDPDQDTKDRIRFGRSASSALAPDVQNAFETRFAIPIVETMGLTETAAQILSNPLPPGCRKVGSPGIAYGNKVTVLAPDLTPLPPMQEGEIAIKGPNVMVEYLRNPDATAASFAGDWLRTGDLGRIDEDGYVFVTGRLKELIIKGGENIAPREIDEALYSHVDVIEAAAFARPCASYGERVEAAVKLRDGSTISSEELIKLCTARLGKFKSPDQVHLLNELPKGPSGKIQRLKLAQLCGS